MKEKPRITVEERINKGHGIVEIRSVTYELPLLFKYNCDVYRYNEEKNAYFSTLNGKYFCSLNDYLEMFLTNENENGDSEKE